MFGLSDCGHFNRTRLNFEPHSSQTNNTHNWEKMLKTFKGTSTEREGRGRRFARTKFLKYRSFYARLWLLT